jgi:hypothetical protein
MTPPQEFEFRRPVAILLSRLKRSIDGDRAPPDRLPILPAITPLQVQDGLPSKAIALDTYSTWLPSA